MNKKIINRTICTVVSKGLFTRWEQLFTCCLVAIVTTLNVCALVQCHSDCTETVSEYSSSGYKDDKGLKVPVMRNPPLNSISFTFMYFSGNCQPNNRFTPQPLRLAPLFGKSRISRCTLFYNLLLRIHRKTFGISVYLEKTINWVHLCVYFHNFWKV